jgi:hypothetical protein
MEELYFNPKRILVRQIEKSIAKDIIIKYHYTHKWSLCKIAYGVFYITDKNSDFFNEKEEKLIGTIIFSQPSGRNVSTSISELIKINEVLELIRLFIFDGYGKNIESYVISKSFNLIKKDFPYIKCIISYADGEQNHSGYIYQATNMFYQGCGETALMPNHSISLIGPPYNWMHSRSVSSKYGSHNIEILKRKIGHNFYKKQESNKHRYFYLLCNKIEKSKILKNLKHPILPYPKENQHKDEIEEIKIDNNEENRFFN